MSSVRFIVVMRMWTYFHANMRNINSIYYIIIIIILLLASDSIE
jgi:hypothetical protein